MQKQLITAAKNGDEAAFLQLNTTYKPLIESMTEKYGVLTEGFGADKDDLRQEAFVAFYKAVMTYDTEQDKVSFGLYAKVCIRNRMISVLRSLKRAAKAVTENAKAKKAQRSPSFDCRALMEEAENTLSKKEKKILSMYLGGKSYAQIANELGIKEKSVDNALFRAKKKLRTRMSAN